MPGRRCVIQFDTLRADIDMGIELIADRDAQAAVYLGWNHGLPFGVNFHLRRSAPRIERNASMCAHDGRCQDGYILKHTLSYVSNVSTKGK